jgi:hypothetical protein
MKCPRCGSTVTRSGRVCLDCSFSLTTVVETFGHQLVRLNRVTDSANCLRVREAQELDDLLEHLGTRFPQVFFAVYFGLLPPSFTPGELSFWLLNHAAFHPGEPRKLNEFAVLMIVDPVGKCAGINVGYGLEAFFPPPKLEKILQRIRTPLWHGEHVQAVTRAMQDVSDGLRHKARAARPAPALKPPESTREFMSRSGLESLRPNSPITRVPKSTDFEWLSQKSTDTPPARDDGPVL